jgi:hypothetical protein
LSRNWEEIIVLGGEGGRVSILGSKTTDDTWIFTKETNESALADILDDEDLSAYVLQKSQEVTDWEQAISLLGRSWIRLQPLFVHPEFKQRIWRDVSSHVEANQLRYWEKLCL